MDMWRFDVSTQKWSIANPDGMPTGISEIQEVGPSYTSDLKYHNKPMNNTINNNPL